jgi:S-formylglutathione hydrolase FrmB
MAMMLTGLRRLAAVVIAPLILAGLLAGPALAQVTVETLSVHSPSVEGNLEANSADREVFVVLPPSYGKTPDRRYPVLYFLHGFTDRARNIMQWIKIAEGAQAAMAAGAQEMIIVVPDSHTRHGGSMYSNSVTIGGFEDFIARDLVATIDGKYRTIARRESRGLAGHSMGGYGTLRIGMKHPEVYSSIYSMSACCLSPRDVTPEAVAKLQGMTVEQAVAGDFMTRATFAVSTAWSPAPEKPPFFADLGVKDGKADPLVVAKWAANAPLAMVSQHVHGLKRMTAIAMDVGDKDFLLSDNVAMHEELLRLGVKHDWTLYQGDHGNRIAQRFGEQVVPFFGRHLRGQ